MHTSLERGAAVAALLVLLALARYSQLLTAAWQLLAAAQSYSRMLAATADVAPPRLPCWHCWRC